MGIIKKGSINKSIHFIIWKIEENETLLSNYLKDTNCTFDHIKNDKVRIQSISARVALHFLLDSLNLKFEGLHKTENGKPYLINYAHPISISHSKNFAAAIIDLNNNTIGIDIEQIQEKVLKLIPRFANSEELVYALSLNGNPENATQIWTIKEAVYKAFGKLNIEFKSQITTKFQQKKPTSVEIKEVNSSFQEYLLEIDQIENNKLAIAYQN